MGMGLGLGMEDTGSSLWGMSMGGGAGAVQGGCATKSSESDLLGAGASALSGGLGGFAPMKASTSGSATQQSASGDSGLWGGAEFGS